MRAGEAGDDAEEVGFEGLDGTFGGIAAMDVRRYWLVGAVPFLGDDAAVFCTGLVVEDLVFDDLASLLEIGHDASVGWYAVAIMFGLEGFDEDGIGVTVVGEHDVLVATARSNGEAAHIVSEELADRSDLNMKFVGAGVGKKIVDAVDGWKGGSWIRLVVAFVLVGTLLALGGADALAGLDKVALDGFGT